MIRLVLGGERSGKSAHAEQLFLADPGPHLFIATGSPVDPAFRKQILRHKAERPDSVPVQECTHDLAQVLDRAIAADEHASFLVDSLDFWFFHCCNRQEARQDSGFTAFQTRALITALTPFRGNEHRHATLVSCEVGLGPIAASRETRQFVRGLGEVHGHVARMADMAQFIIAGCPLTLKGT